MHIQPICGNVFSGSASSQPLEQAAEQPIRGPHFSGWCSQPFGGNSVMQSKDILTRTSLRTPKAAAIAGIVFSILLVVIVSLLRLSVPDDPLEPGAWLSTKDIPNNN